MKAKSLTNACDVGGSIIEGVHSYRYLGFLLDQELTFKADLKQTIRTISQKFYMFKKYKQFLSNKAKLDVVKAMLLSYFTYSNIFHGVCNDNELGELQKLQNSILRSALEINNPRDISIVNLHDVTNTLLLDTRRNYQLLVAVYKAVNSDNIVLKKNVRNLRMFDGLVVQLEHPNTTKFMKTPLYHGGEIWNDLPAEIRNIDNIEEFKNSIRAYQKKMAIRSRGKSPRIAARTAIFNSKKNGDPSRDQSRRIASRSAPRKEMASTFMPSRSPQNIVFRGNIILACTIFVHASIIFPLKSPPQWFFRREIVLHDTPISSQYGYVFLMVF